MKKRRFPLCASFKSGDLLHVNLRSNADNSLLFSVPVHASIVAARPSRHREDGDEAGMGEGAEGGGGSSVEGRLPPSSQWEAQETSSAHVAIEGSHPSLPPRFWPEPRGEIRNGDDNDESRGNSGVSNNLTDDQLDNSVEVPTAASQWKRPDARGWNHSPESFEIQQVRYSMFNFKSTKANI